jgi:hypothetical protein
MRDWLPVSSTDTRSLIAEAIDNFVREVPALRNLKLVVRLELRARGQDAPIWRVELPGPKIAKEPAGDARVEISIGRPEFNRLAAEGRLKDWVDAYERGQIRASGDAGVLKLVGNVVLRQQARGRVMR